MSPKAGPTIRDLCRWGALAQAVRDIKRGYADQDVVDFVYDRWRCGTQEDLSEIVRLAHLGIAAGRLLNAVGEDESILAALIPELPPG